MLVDLLSRLETLKRQRSEYENGARTCPQCGSVKRSNRQKRGLYKCKCGYICNADINGAKNILFKFLESPENVSPLSYDSGVVVRGVDRSIFKFDDSNLNMRRIPVASA